VRIIHLTDLYPPVHGGLETQLEYLCQELVARGHEVDVVTLASRGSISEELRSGVRVHRISGWSRALRPLYEDPLRPFHPTLPDPGIVAALARIVRQRRPDVVHGHSWITYSALPLLPTGTTALVLGLHDFGFTCAKKTYIFQNQVCSGPALGKCIGCAAEQYGRARAAALAVGLASTWRWLRKADRIVANSRAVAEACDRLRPPGAPPIELVPPFLPAPVLEGLRGPRPDFVPQTGSYILFAGGPSPHKGLPVLLQAWQRLPGKVPLVLAGVSRESTPYPIPDAVRMVGQVPHRDVLAAWGHCTVAVVPSIWPEPFGLVALEAMAAGRPLVVARAGNLPDLVTDGENGLVVEPGDVDQLAAALTRLLRDPGMRAAMGASGRLRAAQFTAKSVVPRLESVYLQARERRLALRPGPG
jgi:glycosyltransferase involved in cell wall biosynthesis